MVAEQLGGTPVTLSVVRDGGMFGDVRLYWRVTSSLGSEVNDISPVDGTLVFSEGSTSEVIELTIRDDLVSDWSTFQRCTHTLITLTHMHRHTYTHTRIHTCTSHIHMYTHTECRA